MQKPEVELSLLLRRMVLLIVRNTILVIGVLIALSQVGISLGPLLAGLGVVGFVVGFALQDTLSNFAAGLLILIYRPFDVEDLIEAGGVSGFAMQKEWISALDSRTRDDHAGSNGQRRPENTAFNVGGEKLMYPGDPAGSAGNVINCRCTVAMIPARDNAGNLIPTN